MKLAELQHFFARAVTTGSGPVSGLEDVFRGRGSLGASARLSIYNRAYYYRLLDALSSVFGETRRLMGDSAFERIGLRYITEHPSEHAAVERVGRQFARYLVELSESTDVLASESAVLERPVLDVAALEWARLCSLVAPNPTRVVTPRDIEPNRFPNCRLHFVPSLQLLQLDARALAVFSEREAPVSAQSADPELGAGLEARRLGVAVFREGHVVRQRALPALEYQALVAAEGGKTMREVCALFDTGHDADDAQRAFSVISGWIARHWLDRGLFPGLNLEPNSADW